MGDMTPEALRVRQEMDWARLMAALDVYGEGGERHVEAFWRRAALYKRTAEIVRKMETQPA
jgi:hypothetical protein